MLITGGDDIDTSSVNAAVTENIGELGDVLFKLVKCSCKEMAQIVRKHLIGIDVCLFAQRFHFTPNICTVDGLARFRNEYRSCFDVSFSGIAEQFFLYGAL